MASPVAVLAVIRAARPGFRSAYDRVAFAVHASLLAAGYSLTAVGPGVLAEREAISSESASSAGQQPSEDQEVGIEGWNALDGAYAFRYSGEGQSGLSRALVVKCTVVGDLLMVDAAPLGNEQEPANLEIKVTDYAKDGMAGNYGEQFPNLSGLVDRVNTSVISRVSGASSSKSDARVSSPENSNAMPRQSPLQEEVELESRQPRVSLLEDPPPSHGFLQPEIPGYGGSDLLPGPGAGIFGPRRGIGEGSMLVGPGDPRWGRIGVGPRPPGGPIPPGVPPGARFDPFGPPDVPGFEPDRFIGRGRRPPGGTHPDLEHFNPF